MKLNKTYDLAYFKALAGEGEGVFEALVSVFGNVDFQGDRVMPGAFKNTLETWQKSGKPIPILWSHDWSDPFANVGYANPFDVREIGPGEMPQAPLGGLLVKGRFDVEKPFAKQVYDLVHERRVGEWSFSYDTVKEKRASDGANELIEVKLIEAGPTLKGANAETMTVGVKAEVAKRLEQASKDQAEYDKALASATNVDPTGELTIALMKDGGAKPWHVEERDGKYCVIKNDTNETVDCHDTRQEALAQVRALYASEAASRDEESKTMKAAEPDTEEAMRAHLADAHDSPMSEHEDATMAEMRAMHERMHGEGAGHDHEGMTAEKSESKWDGDAALASAHSAADFRKIAFERDNDSDPDTAAHWALPHHPSPGADADPQGVAAALGALSGGRGGPPDLKDSAAARAHLEAHSNAEKDDEKSKTVIEAWNEAHDLTVNRMRELLGFEPLAGKAGEAVLFESKAGRVIGSKAAAALRSAVTDALDKAISTINGDATEEDPAEKTKGLKAPEASPKRRGPDADILSQLDDLD